MVQETKFSEGKTGAMSEPFMAEIKIVSFNFPPKYWAKCEGALLSISQNQALFSLIGTTYGGNGSTTFALPNLSGRLPIHTGNSFTLGSSGGATTETLSVSQLPPHSHPVLGSSSGGAAAPSSAVLPGTPATANPPKDYATGGVPVEMHASGIGTAGGGQPHDNVQPSLGLNFIIALQGIYPSQA